MALGEVLPLSGPQFLCEEPALALRSRSRSPSLSTSQVCGSEPWVAQRDRTLWPSCGCVWGGCCWSNQMLSDVRALGPLGICSCGPDCQLGPGTLS